MVRHIVFDCPSQEPMAHRHMHLRDAGWLSLVFAGRRREMKPIIRIIFVIGGFFFLFGCFYHLFSGMSGIAFTAGKFQFSYSTIAALALIGAAAYGFGGTKRSKR
jgi:hypothetical protein